MSKSRKLEPIASIKEHKNLVRTLEALKQQKRDEIVRRFGDGKTVTEIEEMFKLAGVSQAKEKAKANMKKKKRKRKPKKTHRK